MCSSGHGIDGHRLVLGHEAAVRKLKKYHQRCDGSRTDGETARLVSYPESTDHMLEALPLQPMSLGDNMLLVHPGPKTLVAKGYGVVQLGEL